MCDFGRAHSVVLTLIPVKAVPAEAARPQVHPTLGVITMLHHGGTYTCCLGFSWILFICSPAQLPISPCGLPDACYAWATV